MSSPTAEIDARKQRAALVSVAVKVTLTLGKFVAAWLSGSLALLSEAGNNLGDVAVTLLSFFSIREAAKPADAEHPFGHGKVEALSALVQTGFLFALALFILIEAAKRLLVGGTDVRPDLFAYGVLVVSIVVDAARWISLRAVARETRSAALAADALNFATDIVASAMALGGLLAAQIGLRLGDPIAAVGVALFVGIAGYRLGRETVDTLLDAAPKGVTEPLRQLIDAVPGVIAVDQVRLRPMGAGVVGDVRIHVSRTLSLERVAAIKAVVAEAIAREHPDVAVEVTADPVALDDETVVDRVLHIAHRRQVPVHHVTVQTFGRRKSVSFDVEVDGRMSLGHAHDVVTQLETAIGSELGEDFEIESHIEPMEVSELDGRDCDGPTLARIEAVLAHRLPESAALSDVHDVRVRTTPSGLVVNYHCLAESGLSVDAVHAAVDDFERKVRQDCAAIARIVGHAEPTKARDHA